MRQCNEHEKRSEYVRSCNELRDFLKHERTVQDLSVSCRVAVTTFAEALVGKEKYLGNHIRMYTTNCMDSETTSPVESQNSIVKEKLGISGKMDIQKGIEKIADNTNRTIQRQKEEALRMLNLANMASRSPTKDIMIPKSQAIEDGNFDCRNRYCLVKAGENEWWCWNFDRDKAEYAWPWNAIPQFVRVRKVTRTIYNRQTFLRCDCGYYDRIGIPCGHIFRLVNCMSMEMFHICHWKVYDAHYGDKTRLGSLMIQAQVCTLLYYLVLTLQVYLYITNYSLLETIHIKSYL